MTPYGKNIPSARSIISAAATFSATVLLIRTVTKELLPTELQNSISFQLQTLLYYAFSSEFKLIVEEYEGLNLNQLFKAVELYLQSKIPKGAKQLRLTMLSRESTPSISLEKNEEIVDDYNGMKLKWRFKTKRINLKFVAGEDSRDTPTTESRFFELSFHKKHKEKVIDFYIPHLLNSSEELKKKKKTLKLYTLRNERSLFRQLDLWQSVNLHHPATFDTLAMDAHQKTEVLEDLERFVKRREFYKRVGKAWKRGYLLYGPPGTGKSSLIAAMANYLHFDIYDLDLAALETNSELRSLLISTGNKSILVVEDIDCSLNLNDRMKEATTKGSKAEHEVTLSGLLNFIDGLWSSCGDERIIIFTTNHKDKLDPALLRPGRMDLHIHMSYCTPYGFKMLAFRYLGTLEHPLFPRIVELMETIKVTPAEVGEQLMRSEEPDSALHGFVEFLQQKKKDDMDGFVEFLQQKKKDDMELAAAQDDISN